MGMSSGPAPTRAEALRMRLIGEGCCIACIAEGAFGTACEVHHLTSGDHHGQVRLGHAYTVGLCGWHHRGELPLDLAMAMGHNATARIAAELGPSFAKEPNAFRKRYGGIPNLLKLQAAELARVCRTYVIPPRGYACPLS